MNERHARAATRCAVAAITVGLAAIVVASVVPLHEKYLVCAALAVIDLVLLSYLWLATVPEPEQRSAPSATRARIEAARRRREQRGG